MENNGTSEEQLQQADQQQQPPLFDNVDITSPDDENENDIFESAIQVWIYPSFDSIIAARAVSSLFSHFYMLFCICMREQIVYQSIYR